MARWTTTNWKETKMARKSSSRQPARMPLEPRKILRGRLGGRGAGVKSGMAEIGLTGAGSEFMESSRYFGQRARAVPQGLKPSSSQGHNVGAEAPTPGAE